MILLFSEAKADYRQYLYPYVIWALPEPGEKPRDFFRRGFLPGSPEMDRYYLCRNLRVDLHAYRPTSENRRIRRKGQGITGELIPRAAFDYSEVRRQSWKDYADERFGENVMSLERLDRLMGAPVISHLLEFRDSATGREAGTVLLYLDEPDVAYYYYAFYDLEYLERNLGMYMMTWAVDCFARRGVAHLHLGTCYSERALYKTQFDGVEFCNGLGWSRDREEIKYLIRRDRDNPGRHLLDTPDFLARFYGDSLPRLGQTSQWRLRP